MSLSLCETEKKQLEPNTRKFYHLSLIFYKYKNNEKGLLKKIALYLIIQTNLSCVKQNQIKAKTILSQSKAAVLNFFMFHYFLEHDY